MEVRLHGALRVDYSNAGFVLTAEIAFQSAVPQRLMRESLGKLLLLALPIR